MAVDANVFYQNGKKMYRQADGSVTPAEADTAMVNGQKVWAGGPYAGMPVSQYPNGGDLLPYLTNLSTPDPTGRAQAQAVAAAAQGAPTQTTAAAPSLLPPTAGITAGQYEDYKAMVSQALSQLGFQNLANDWKTMDPSTDATKLGQIVNFARTGADLEAVMNQFRNDPSLVAINPGLPYGLSREDYYAQRESMEKAFGSQFGDPADLGAVSAKAKNPTAGGTPPEADWEGAVFHEKLSPQQSSQMFQDYFTRLGRAPNAGEIGRYATKASQKYSDQAVLPTFTQSTVGPQSKGLAGPERNIRGG